MKDSGIIRKMNLIFMYLLCYCIAAPREARRVLYPSKSDIPVGGIPLSEMIILQKRLRKFTAALLNRHTLIVIMMIFALSSTAFAIGVAPSKAEYEFKAGQIITYPLDIVNNGHENLEVLIYARGEFSENVKLNKQMLTMKSDEETKRVNVYFTMPERMDKAGEHTLEIVAVGTTPVSESKKAVVKADLAVISKLTITVPYPEKYAEAKAYVLDTEAGKPISVNLPVFNKGSVNLDEVYAKVEIYSADGEKLDEVVTGKQSIKKGESAKFIAESSKKYEIGEYKAVATVYYDDKTTFAETYFNVGELTLEVRSLVVDKFTLGDVARFDILLYNQWSSELKNVYAEMQITDDNNKVYTEFKTVAANINSHEIGRLEGYWYTQDVMPGFYYARITLHYANKISQKDFELEVQPNSITARPMGIGRAVTATEEVNIQKNGYLVLIVVVMGGIIVALAVKLRKKREAKQPKAGQQVPVQPPKVEEQTPAQPQAAIATEEKHDVETPKEQVDKND
jgi:hypothetical protein